MAQALKSGPEGLKEEETRKSDLFSILTSGGESGCQTGQAGVWPVWVRSGPVWVGVGKRDTKPKPEKVGGEGVKVNNVIHPPLTDHDRYDDLLR